MDNKNIKENYLLITEAINKLTNSYTKEDIMIMIEISYFLGVEKDRIKELNNIINTYSVDGLKGYVAFIELCFDNFVKSKSRDIYTFLEENLEENIEQFKDKYYMEHTYEYCPHCETESKIYIEGGKCEICGRFLKPCSMCDMNKVKCNECKFDNVEVK